MSGRSHVVKRRKGRGQDWEGCDSLTGKKEVCDREKRERGENEKKESDREGKEIYIKEDRM
jgi:hypothetical protein